METQVQLEMSETPDTDLLICGSCKRSFQLANILGFMKHKKFDCEDPGSLIDPNNKVLLCQACRQKFNTPWSLLKHAQNVHFLRIYLEQTYHVPSISLEEEPRNISFSTTNGIFSSSQMNTKLFTNEQSMSASESFVESTDFVTKESSEQTIYVSPLKIAADKVVKAESESISQTSANSYDMSPDSKIKEDDSSKTDPVCCDDQDCGINIMPGTHESLKRCCSAVVPKKRKRHMEVKHRMNFLSRMRRQRNRSSSPASIIIDVTAPESEQVDSKEDPHPSQESTPKASDNKMTGDSSQYSANKMNSVIIQPGSTFSIPISFARTAESDMEQPMSYSSSATLVNLPPSLQVVSLSPGRLPNDVSCAVSQPATLSEISNNSGSLGKDSDVGKSSTPNILQGILARMFSEKTEIMSGRTSSNVEMTVPHDVIDLKQEVNVSDQCNKTDKSQASAGRNLNGKKRRYPTSRPYKCDQCNDAFNQRIHLKKHQSKHTGIKPFKCDLCDYATVERSHLKVHIRVHTGEKPFKCTYCEYATAQRSTLKIHLKRHHSATDHCLHCSRRDHSECYPSVMPPGADNNNIIQSAANMSSCGTGNVKTPENTSITGGTDVVNER